jgi:hypothetical protein
LRAASIPVAAIMPHALASGKPWGRDHRQALCINRIFRKAE